MTTMLRRSWETLSPLPCGRHLFSFLFGMAVPYTGGAGLYVASLEPGRAVVELRDRRRVRNHLRSIHAVALANLAEATSGLALNVSLQEGQRAILTAFSIQYLKKGRGRLTATSIVEKIHEGDNTVSVAIVNQTGQTVATAQAIWRVGTQA